MSTNLPVADALAVTGVGLLTPLGHSAWETWRALLDGRRLTDRCANLPADVDPVQLVQTIGGVSVGRHVAEDPAVDLAERAARQAIAEADCTADALPTVLAASKGMVHHLPSQMAEGPMDLLARRLTDRLGLGPVRCATAACASSLVGLHLARQWMLHEGVERVLVVSSEAALLPMFIHSYRRLGVLAKLTPDAYRARPIDQRRSGFVLSELAAAVVLERRPTRRPLTYLADTAVAAEAFDLVRTPERPQALRHIAGRLLAEGVDLLHPHATGTAVNDESELQTYAGALDAASPVRVDRPDVYACKGALGHGLGTAGLVSVVLAALAARTGRRPPMPWLERPLNSPFELKAASPPRPIRRQAVFAAGFGGHVAGVRLVSD